MDVYMLKTPSNIDIFVKLVAKCIQCANTFLHNKTD